MIGSWVAAVTSQASSSPPPPRPSPSQLSRALTGHTASNIPPSPRCSQLLFYILNRRTRPGAVFHPLDFRWRHSGDGTLLHPPTPARTKTATIPTATTTPTTPTTTPGNYHDDHDSPRAVRPCSRPSCRGNAPRGSWTPSRSASASITARPQSLILPQHYSNFPATGVSLRQMVQFGEKPSTGTLFRASQFLSEELPIRLAHRVQELNELPDGLNEMPSICRVRDWYAQSFEVRRHDSPHLLQHPLTPRRSSSSCPGQTCRPTSRTASCAQPSATAKTRW
jgi:hypothetical protein